MLLRTLGGGSLKGKRVLVRIDGNVEIKNGRAVDGLAGRIARSALGIQALRNRGARVIVLTHLGRPKNAKDDSARVGPVAKRLSQLLKTKVAYDGSLVGPNAKRLVEGLQDGDVAMLENVRFDKREEKNDLAFAKQLAELADIYVNDAFAVCHRAHASMVAIQKFLPSYAGPLLQAEVSGLSKAMEHPQSPFVLMLGGAKMETKIGLLEKLGPKADRICVGGALANTFLAAIGLPMGNSLYEKDQIKQAQKIIKRFAKKLVLPMDFVLNGTSIEDAGPASIKAFEKEIATAKTIVWNGPFGRAEDSRFVKCTRAIAKAIALNKGVTIVGGGDTLPLMERWKLTHAFTLLSTGGGAMLAFLSGEKMPGIAPLVKK